MPLLCVKHDVFIYCLNDNHLNNKIFHGGPNFLFKSNIKLQYDQRGGVLTMRLTKATGQLNIWTIDGRD